MSGQSVMDRVMAAKHSIAGQGLAKSVCKASTEEVMGPKKKHLDYLIQCTNEPNVSIPQLANLLIERTQHANWVVVFKSLVTIHNVMNYGNERFTQYLASNNCTFNLSGFLDKTGVQGYDMSTYIRRYSKYLNEKAFSYRQMAFDFCKVKRGKEDGLLRTMTGEKLIKTLPVLQAQVDALLDFEVSPNELTNGVINACFMLLFKDLIRLFACYNDGIINLLEKYFEMSKKQCREALEQYKKFLVRMQRVSEFLKVAENVGIDRGDIPDLAKAPSSLLEALEEHLKSLESKKGAHITKVEKPAGVAATINSFAAAAQSTAIVSNVSDEERRKILEEEQKQLDKMKKEQQLKTGSPTSQPSASASPANNPFGASPQTNSPSQNMDLFGDGPVGQPAGLASDDLLGLSGAGAPPAAQNPFAQNNPFAAAAAPPPAAAPMGASPWGAPGSQPGATGTQNSNATSGKFVNEDQFAAVFGGKETAEGGAMVNNTTNPPPAAPKEETLDIFGMDNIGAPSVSGAMDLEAGFTGGAPPPAPAPSPAAAPGLDLSLTSTPPSTGQPQPAVSPSIAIPGLDMSMTSAPMRAASPGLGQTALSSSPMARSTSPIPGLDMSAMSMPAEQPRSTSPAFPSGLDMSKTSAPMRASSPGLVGQGLEMPMTDTPPLQRSASPGAGLDMSLTSTPPMTASPGFDGFGEILRPQGSGAQQNKPQQPLVGSAAKPEEKKLIGSDLDTSIASLAGNLTINGAGFQSKKSGMQWNQPSGDKRMTGGMNWQAPVASSTTLAGQQPMGQPMAAPYYNPTPAVSSSSWNATSPGMPNGYHASSWVVVYRPVVPAGNMGMMGQPGFQQQPMGYQQMGQPMGMQQPGMGFPQQAGMQQTAMYGQPRPPAQQQPQPNDPFGAL